MTKEQFIEQMTVIEDYLAARRKAGAVLNETFFKGSWPPVFDFGDELITLAIEQLAELSGIDSKSVEWFARGNRGVCSCFDGFKRHIRTPADLWIIEKHNDKAL